MRSYDKQLAGGNLLVGPRFQTCQNLTLSRLSVAPLAWLTLGNGLAMVLVLAGPLWGATKDSRNFPYRYEGNTVSVPKYDQVGVTSPVGPFTSGPTSDGDILSYNSTIGTGEAFWQSRVTGGDRQEWRDLISDAVGWTLEMRVKVRTGGIGGSEGAFRFAVSDGVDYGSDDKNSPDARGSFTLVSIRSDGIWTSDGNGVQFEPLTGEPNPNHIDDEFHVYRFAQLPSSSDFRLWVDDELFLESHGFDYVGIGSQPSQHWFGDGGGLAGGRFVDIDYIRWDHTGVYEPGLSIDLNGDGAIDAADAGIMFGNWGQAGNGDLNGDGIVDAADAGQLFASWTGDASPVSSPVVVPEPVTIMVSLVGLLSLFAARSGRSADSWRK